MNSISLGADLPENRAAPNHKKLKGPIFPLYLLQSILWLYSIMLCAVSVQRLTWRSEVICTDLKVTSSFQTGCACPMATLVRFIWLSHCKKRKGKFVLFSNHNRSLLLHHHTHS